jgi:hypothetical protein
VQPLAELLALPARVEHVPRHDEAHVADAQRLEAMVEEHLRLLVRDADDHGPALGADGLRGQHAGERRRHRDDERAGHRPVRTVSSWL